MAISKERLEELIRQKATIYSTHWQEEVDLSLPCEINELEYDDRVITRLVVFEDDEHAPSYMLDSLTEDIEGAKWDMRFKRIPRTDYLDLPTWEEFKKKQLKNKCYCVPFIGADPGCFYQLFIDAKTEEITIYDCDCEDIVFSMKQNQKNYTLACEKARELFLGEQQ